MNRLFMLLLVFLCWSCVHNPTEKNSKSKRDKIVRVKDKIKEIEITDVMCNRFCDIYLMNDYFIIVEHRSTDKQIHLFYKNDFRYITSAAPIGQGPGEITNMGDLIVDEVRRRFYVCDNGKQKIFSYELDSVLVNPFYMPEVKMDLNATEHPKESQFINDTLLMGLVLEPTGISGFQLYTAKWNINTGEFDYMEDLHPEIERKRYSVAISLEQGIYVECFHHHDLMCIRKLDGELVYNIYGRHWNTETSNKSLYYNNRVVFCKDKIVSLYVGGNNFYIDKNGSLQGVWPTKLIVFDSNGEYIKTLETGYNICDFCYDEANNRLIMSMNNNIQFGYLELEGLLN